VVASGLDTPWGLALLPDGSEAEQSVSPILTPTSGKRAAGPDSEGTQSIERPS